MRTSNIWFAHFSSICLLADQMDSGWQYIVSTVYTLADGILFHNL